MDWRVSALAGIAMQNGACILTGSHVNLTLNSAKDKGGGVFALKGSALAFSWGTHVHSCIAGADASSLAFKP